MTLFLQIFIHLSFGQILGATQTPSLNFNTDGIVIKHEPSHFTLQSRFRIQSRFSMEKYDSSSQKSDVTDFTVRRMRLRFDGTAFDPRFLYRIQLSFTNGDMDFDNTNYPNILRDAAIGWKLTDKSTFWFGQTKLPGNRQRVISSGNLELVDRSLLNAIFNIDRDMGLQWYNQFGNETPVWLKLAISNGEGRANNNKNTGLAYTARLEWLPLGKFIDDGDYFEGDLAHEETPKISIGTTYSTNKKTNRTGGQTGRTITDGTTTNIVRDIDTILADFLLKYKGWAWTTEYAWRDADTALAPISASTTDAIYKGQAISTQLSYVMSHHFSPIVRYTRLFPHKDIWSKEDAKIQYTVGLTKYVNNHKVKLQADATLEDEKNKISGKNQQNWYFRAQLEFGI